MSQKEFKFFPYAAVAWLVITFCVLLWLLFWPGTKDANFLRGIGLYAVGVGIAPLGLYLAFRRTQTSGEQSENDKKLQINDEKRRINDEKRRIGEEFARSIELLGGKSAAVRQGGIYALEALAEETEGKKLNTIVKIVASYIRETNKAKVKPADTGGTVGVSTEQTEGKGKTVTGRAVIETDGVDIAAALSVIQNLSQRIIEEAIDLSNIHLRTGGDLSRAQLHGNMSDVIAVGCVFVETSFCSANMGSAKFYNCDFTNADFSKADLNKARFLEKCNFQNAKLHGAQLYGANLSGATNLTHGQIDVAQGDGETVLPAGLTRPRNWR